MIYLRKWEAKLFNLLKKSKCDIITLDFVIKSLQIQNICSIL